MLHARHLRARSATQSYSRRELASVVVVAWNAQAVLGRCLEQLLGQDHPNYEVIVVDDGSTDETAAVAEAAAANGDLKLVRGGRNRGCPAARNIGLRHARGEIVAFVDADGFVVRNWLSRVVASFDDDHRTGGVASAVFFDDNPLVLNGAGGTINRQGWAADLSMNESFEDVELATEALYPMGCGMAFTREALERVGAFDDRIVNYYDDVDYGIRVWRAGYRVRVAHDAWIDHGFSATGDESPRKRLLCERHRMRVVLKHAAARTLRRWMVGELRSLAEGSAVQRRRKLAAIAWNAGHLPSVLAFRHRHRAEPRAPERLIDDSWGDAFPAGMPQHATPVPERAAASVAMTDSDAGAQLLYGWFPLERAGARGYRWAGEHAALLVSLTRPARRLRLDYAHVPEDTGGVELAIRRIDADDPLAAVWRTRLRWQYLARSIENHPLELPAGDYEVRLSAAGWLEPPLQVRSLSVALSCISFEERVELPSGGLAMSSPGVEDQLVHGWFELESSPAGGYRWSSAQAALVARLADHASAVRLHYRLAPGPGGPVTVSLTAVGSSVPAVSWQIPWQQGEWQQVDFPASLAPGEYLVRFDTERTWSNVNQHDRSLPPENRALGLALAELRFL